jgi:hypothetical protein
MTGGLFIAINIKKGSHPVGILILLRMTVVVKEDRKKVNQN